MEYVSHTAGCGVPDTTPAPENNVAICPGGEKKSNTVETRHSLHPIKIPMFINRGELQVQSMKFYLINHLFHSGSLEIIEVGSQADP